MTIAQALAAKTLELRKARDEIAPSFQSVLGFAQANAKERARVGGNVQAGADISEDDALRAITKGIKMCRDTIEAAKSAEKEHPNLALINRELSELEALLPSMTSDADVSSAAGEFLATQGERNMKLMGPTMAHLTGLFGTSLDKGKASGIVKQLINQ